MRSPGEKAGDTLQPTMKSWQLIAVVGDALQVRRERKALNAGGDTVGVSWGFRSRQELEAFCPLAVIDEAKELQALL